MHLYLEIIASLIGLYIVFSIINSVLIEFLGDMMNARGRFLKSRVFLLLEGRTRNFNWLKELWRIFSFENRKKSTWAFCPKSKSLGNRFYAHDFIRSEFKTEYRWPSKIDKEKFASTIVSLYRPVIDSYHKNLGADFSRIDFNSPGVIRETIAMALASSDDVGGLSRVETALTKQYESFSNQVSAWYKVRIRLWLFLSGIIMAALFNIDTIAMYNHLERDGELRRHYYAETVNLADEEEQMKQNRSFIKEVLVHTSEGTVAADSALIKILEIMDVEKSPEETAIYAGLGIKYMGFNPDVESIIGILITAIALSFGSTFWFDMLRNILRLKP